MTTQQISKLVGTLVEHQSFFKVLSTEDAQWAIKHPQEVIALCVSAIENRVKEVAQKLLQPLTTIKVSAVSEFIAADHFKVGETVDDVKISRSMGENFSKHFLSKTEKNVAEAEIKVHKLLTSSKDDDIRKEIGKANEEIQLAHFWQVLKAHGDGKIGDWYIGYITGVHGKLWAVSACWYDDGWDLVAVSVVSSSPWCAGYQICSR